MLNRNSTLLLAALTISNVAHAALNDTGIKTCSNADTNGLPCPVAGFPGQDAEFGTNAFNYTKLDANGNAMPVTATNHTCVQDNVTGIMWEVKTDDGGLRDKDWTYTWYDSNSTDGNLGTSSGGSCSSSGRCDTEKFVADVNAQGLCGHNDWRVPNPQELASIVDYSIPYPGPTIDTDVFPNSVSDWFWTSSPYADSSTFSWIVLFGNGNVEIDHRDYSDTVRLARGGQLLLPFSFTDQGDGTVKDNNTGLIWAKCSEGQSGTDCSAGRLSNLTWAQALTAASNSTLAGYSDWRLPNTKELQSLVDYTSINATYFPATPLSWFWTSSPYAADSSHSWIVLFYGGYVGHDYRYYGLSVRIVRGGTVPLSSFSLNITKIGTGTGTITSNPTGINCGTDCSENYASSTAVTLTATPTAGSNFAGWSGACSGTATTCSVTMDADRSATATFNLKTFTITPSLNPASGGTVTPNTAQTVNYGTTKMFTVTANNGYTKSNVVSGTCSQGSWNGNVWTTGAITATCTVIFNFTAPGPTATTNAASNINGTSATLNGSVISSAATANVTFDFGTSTSYGESITATPYQVYSASAVAVSASKTGLTCNSVYHYRTKAVSSAGTGYGVDQSFTTATCPISYTVTPSATTIPAGANGGSFFPETATTVTAGTTTSFTVIPATTSGGYTTNPTVTGTCSLGSWGGTWNNIWTTGPITANCTVIFGFTAINSWIAPPNQTIIPDQAFTLDVTVKSNSVKVGWYTFVVTFDPAKLRLDNAYQDATGLCINGICPGTSALTNRFPPVIDANTITLTGNDAVGKGPGNDLQLLVMHFRGRYVAEAPSFVTTVALKTNILATVYGDNIGTGARGATVNVSTGLCGDADGNTSVNIVDALAIARKVVGMPPPPTVEDVLADVNRDARVAITDALHIARYSVGLLTPPEVCAIGVTNMLPLRGKRL